MLKRSNQRVLPDVSVMLGCLLLFGIGLSALYSVSLAKDAGWAHKQLVWGLLAAMAAMAAASCSLSVWRRHAPKLFIFTVLGLAATFLFESRNGAHRWLFFGGFSVQPSEFFKWTALLLAACFAARPHYKRRQTVFVLPVLGWMCIPMLLVALQRDFGSLVLISVVVLAVLFLSGLDWRWVGGLFVGLSGLAWWLITQTPYRLGRLTSFMDPFTAAGGYHQKHALIAFEQGGLFGDGVGRSIEKWGYLPEAHNDFIISIIAEENGLFGMLLVCILLAVIAARAVAIGNAAEARGDIFAALYSFGAAALLSLQSVINIGGNLALLPFKGFTLPLVSYGGSSMLATGLIIGVLLRVDYENQQEALVARTVA